MAFSWDRSRKGKRFYQTGRFALGLLVTGTIATVITVILMLRSGDDFNTSFRYSGKAPGFGDRVWRVAQESPPGTYDNQGGTASCRWARLRGFSGQPADVIERGGGEGHQFVLIERTDVGFETIGCGVWERIQPG